jgi:hypothetical protein
MRGDRNKPIFENQTSRVSTLGLITVFVGWLALLCLCSLVLLWAAPSAYGGSASSGKKTDNEIKTRFSAGQLMGIPVNDSEGNRIAEIKDFILNDIGRVRLVVLATGGFADIGEKTIAVPFADLSFERQWNKRTVRTDEGTLVKVPWQAQWTAVYREKAPDLKDLPEYAPADENLRGGASGWGVYSAPTGPSNWEEVTDPSINPE